MESCASGFIDEELLRNKAAQITSTSGDLSNNRLAKKIETRWFFPDLQFHCATATLTSVTLGIDVRVVGNLNPIIELWQQDGKEQFRYNRIKGGHTVELKPENSTVDGVFHLTISPPLVLLTHYILGIYQPEDSNSTVRFFYDTNTTSTAYQLNNVIGKYAYTTVTEGLFSTVTMENTRPLIHVETGMCVCIEVCSLTITNIHYI